MKCKIKEMQNLIDEQKKEGKAVAVCYCSHCMDEVELTVLRIKGFLQHLLTSSKCESVVALSNALSIVQMTTEMRVVKAAGSLEESTEMISKMEEVKEGIGYNQMKELIMKANVTTFAMKENELVH